MKHLLFNRALLAATLLPGLASAAASDEELLRCRALADIAARVACYDALPVGQRSAPAAPAPAAATPAATAAATAAATPSPKALAAQPPSAAAVAGFGMERVGSELSEIRSRISGRFEGWTPRARLRLDNGQVWQVVDDSSGFYELPSPLVTVRRAAMGTFMMEIEGARRAPRVRRVE
ncbi:MAG: hypothetical protein Q7U99_16205 [Rubrivivax sp.]|nr:hypothetical protein [Rubrivivax sp.]MDP3224288.1 hypothetical protein [Rubrivivax sp.]